MSALQTLPCASNDAADLRAAAGLTNINLTGTPESQASRLASSVDNGRTISGREYLWKWHSDWRATPSRFVLGMLSGDSTTVGQNALVSSNQPAFALQRLLADRGMLVPVPTVSAYSGKSTADWLNTYLPADLAGTVPIFYVMRWGMNDAAAPLTVAQTIANIRSGLASIRGTAGWANTVLILMTPNTSSDDAGGRNETWHESIRQGYAQAARDYGCVFIDTYAELREARNNISIGTNLWLDAAKVHPNDDHYLSIMSLVADVLCPPHLSMIFNEAQYVTAGSGFALPTAGSAYGAMATLKSGGRLCASRGYIVPPAGAIASGTVIATIAAHHRPFVYSSATAQGVSGQYAMVGKIWNGSAAGSISNWEDMPVVVGSDGTITAMKTSTMTSISRFDFEGVVWTRG